MSIFVPDEQDVSIVTAPLKSEYIRVTANPSISAASNLFVCNRHKDLAAFKHEELSNRTHREIASSINQIDWTTLFDNVTDCSINSNADSDIRTTATLSLALSYYEYSQFFNMNNIKVVIDENSTRSIVGNNDWFWLNMILSIEYGYKDLTNKKSSILWYKQGDFVVVSSNYSQDNQLLTLTLNDMTVLLNGSRHGSIKASKFLAETHKTTEDDDRTVIELIPTRFHNDSWELKTTYPIKKIKKILAPCSAPTERNYGDTTVRELKRYSDFDTFADYVDYISNNRPDANITYCQEVVLQGKVPYGWSYLNTAEKAEDGWWNRTNFPYPAYNFTEDRNIIQLKYPLCRSGTYFLYMVEYYPTYTPNQIVDIIDTTLTDCSEIKNYQLDVIGAEYGTIKAKGLIADSIETTISCDKNTDGKIKADVNTSYDKGTKNYFDPLYTCLPYDINVDSDVSVWSILTKLRDLYPNWQMYFDREGKFICNRISAGLDDPCYTTISDDIVLKKELSKDLSDFHNITNIFCPDVEADFFCSRIRKYKSEENWHYTYTSAADSKKYTVGATVYELTFKTSFNNQNEIEDYLWENDCFTIGFNCNAYYNSEDEEDNCCGDIPETGTYPNPIFLNLIFESLEDDGGGLKISYVPLTKVTGDNDTTYPTPDGIFEKIEKDDSVIFQFSKTGIVQGSGSGYDITNGINYACNLTYLGKLSSIIATAKNDNSDDNYSIYSVGDFEHNLSGSEYEKIYTVDDAYARANYENWKSSRTANEISIDIITIPWLEVNQKVEYEGEQYLVNSISRNYKTNVDSLSLSKFYPLYSDTTVSATKSSTAPNRYCDLIKYRHIDLAPYTHEEIRKGDF